MKNTHKSESREETKREEATRAGGGGAPAAAGGPGPSYAADAGEQAAVDAEETVDATRRDAERAEDSLAQGGHRLHRRLSLAYGRVKGGISRDTHGDQAGAARVGGRLPGGNGRDRCGDRKKREGKRGDDGELGEHR